MQGRQPSGFSRNGDQARRDTAEAKTIENMVLGAMNARGLTAQAARLGQPGPEGYPGEDELRYYAEVLGGQIEIDDPVRYLREQGHARPGEVVDEDMLALWAEQIGGRVERLPSTMDSKTIAPMIVVGDERRPRLYRVKFEMHADR
eukprot:3257679-Pyramimonas_sp.AAC.1